MENWNSSFSFQHVPKDKITNTIEKLDPKKVVQSNYIPTKLIKSFSGFFSDYVYIYINLNKCFKNGEDFKKAEMHPLYKKDGRKEKSNYRPISILSNVSKVYERCLYDQIYDFLENKFSRYQCRFRKDFDTQNALLSMVEKMLLACGKKRTLWSNINWSVRSFWLYQSWSAHN